MFKLLFRPKSIQTINNWQIFNVKPFHKQILNTAGLFKPTQIICKFRFFFLPLIYNKKKTFYSFFFFLIIEVFFLMAKFESRIAFYI